MTIKEIINQHIKYNTDEIKKESDKLTLCSILGILNQECSSIYRWSDQLHINCKNESQLKSFVDILLSKVHKFNKEFKEKSGTFEYTGTYVNEEEEITITLEVTPTTCTIEKIEEEVEIPARKEKRVRYVPVGDCNPLMSLEKKPEEMTTDELVDEFSTSEITEEEISEEEFNQITGENEE